MAIIVEEEKNRSNIVQLLGWVVVIAVIAIAIYYIFFAAPQLVVITPTGTLSTIAPITQINLDPQSVITNPAFQALQSTIPAPSATGPVSVGRLDPFVAP